MGNSHQAPASPPQKDDDEETVLRLGNADLRRPFQLGDDDLQSLNGEIPKSIHSRYLRDSSISKREFERIWESYIALAQNEGVQEPQFFDSTNYATGERILVSIPKLNSIGRMYLTEPELAAIRTGKLRRYLRAFISETPLFPQPIGRKRTTGSQVVHRGKKGASSGVDQPVNIRLPITARSQSNFQIKRSTVLSPHLGKEELEEVEGHRAMSFSARLKKEGLSFRDQRLKNNAGVLKQVCIDLSSKSPRMKYTPRHNILQFSGRTLGEDQGVPYDVRDSQQSLGGNSQSVIMMNNTAGDLFGCGGYACSKQYKQKSVVLDFEDYFRLMRLKILYQRNSITNAHKFGGEEEELPFGKTNVVLESNQEHVSCLLWPKFCSVKSPIRTKTVRAFDERAVEGGVDWENTHSEKHLRHVLNRKDRKSRKMPLPKPSLQLHIPDGENNKLEVADLGYFSQQVKTLSDLHPTSPFRVLSNVKMQSQPKPGDDVGLSPINQAMLSPSNLRFLDQINEIPSNEELGSTSRQSITVVHKLEGSDEEEPEGGFVGVNLKPEGTTMVTTPLGVERTVSEDGFDRVVTQLGQNLVSIVGRGLKQDFQNRLAANLSRQQAMTDGQEGGNSRHSSASIVIERIENDEHTVEEFLNGASMTESKPESKLDSKAQTPMFSDRETPKSKEEGSTIFEYEDKPMPPDESSTEVVQVEVADNVHQESQTKQAQDQSIVEIDLLNGDDPVRNSKQQISRDFGGDLIQLSSSCDGLNHRLKQSIDTHGEYHTAEGAAGDAVDGQDGQEGDHNEETRIEPLSESQHEAQDQPGETLLKSPRDDVDRNQEMVVQPERTGSLSQEDREDEKEVGSPDGLSNLKKSLAEQSGKLTQEENLRYRSQKAGEEVVSSGREEEPAGETEKDNK